MGCSTDLSLFYDGGNHKIPKILQLSSDETIRKYANHKSAKNLEIFKHILEENEISLQKLKKKIDELVIKGENTKPIQIATAKCGNPCYTYQMRIFSKCPKCDGRVFRNMENESSKSRYYDDMAGFYREGKSYSNKNICTRFNFENIDKCDVDIDEFIKFFEKVDEEKTVHWSADTKIKEWDRSDPVVPVEKDMPIHYMMVDGERFDFPYGIHMREFFMINYEKLCNACSVGEFLSELKEDYFRDDYVIGKGEKCDIYDGLQNTVLGQSCGFFGWCGTHYVYIYECDDCHHKYHVIKTSLFRHRDISKDPK